MKAAIAVALFASSVCLAQPKPSSYLLAFTLRETPESGKPVERQYTMLTASGNRARIISGTKLPFYAKEKETHMVSLGNNLECMTESREDKLHLDCSIELSEVASAAPRPVGFPPQIHSQQAQVVTDIPLDTPVTLATLDNPVTRSHVEIIVNATRR